MFVDGELVIAARDTQSLLLGGGNDRVGLYFYMPAKVLNLRVYVKRFTGGPGME